MRFTKSPAQVSWRSLPTPDFLRLRIIRGLRRRQTPSTASIRPPQDATTYGGLKG